MRLTKLDECCAPPVAATPCSVITTSGFISAAFSPEISEAEEIEVKNAAGEICITDPGCDEVKWMNVVLTMCGVDPDLMTFTTGSPLVLDHAGVSVGNRIRIGQSCSINFGMELWTDVPQTQCTPGGDKQYGYFLLPCVSSGVIGDFTIENGALNLVINARAKAASGWGTGPYDVDPTAVVGVPGPLLTPMGVNDVMDMHLTTVAPPAAVCGCVAMPA